jgi:hypothetical protein
VYEGYEVLYQRLRLGADNKSTKQSPIDRGNNINGNDDKSIFHLVGGYGSTTGTSQDKKKPPGWTETQYVLTAVKP